MIKNVLKKLKCKLGSLLFKTKENAIDLLFVLGCLLIYIALFNIHINLGLISTGVSFIYFAIILHFDKKQKDKKNKE